MVVNRPIKPNDHLFKLPIKTGIEKEEAYNKSEKTQPNICKRLYKSRSLSSITNVYLI